MGTHTLPQNGRSPQFSAHVNCGQTTACFAWIKMPLGTEVGLGLRDVVLDGDPAPPPIKGHSPPIVCQCRLCQTTGWTKMPLGIEVGLGPVDFDGGSATPRKKGTRTSPNFWPISMVAKRLDGSRCHLVRR